MQDPTTTTTTTTLHPMMMNMKQQQPPPQFPEQEQQQLKCPRCDSTNTKFCYYNNYNLSQPRHFCKNCRRYWTKGGALRNIPIGGGTRKNAKRSSPSPSSSSTPSKRSNLSSKAPSPPSVSARPDPDLNDPGHDPARVDGKNMGCGHVNFGGSFSSLLASTVQWGGLWEGLNSSGPGLRMMHVNEFGENNDMGSGNLKNLDSGMGRESNIGNGDSGGILGNKQNVDSSCWNSGSGGGGGGGGSTNGWSDLAIYTPGSSYQ